MCNFCVISSNLQYAIVNYQPKETLRSQSSTPSLTCSTDVLFGTTSYPYQLWARERSLTEPPCSIQEVRRQGRIMGKDRGIEWPRVTLALKHGDGMDLYELIYFNMLQYINYWPIGPLYWSFIVMLQASTMQATAFHPDGSSVAVGFKNGGWESKYQLHCIA